MLKVENIQRLDLGIQGENQARTIEIDCTLWQEMFENCDITILHKRPGETEKDLTSASYDAETHVLSWTPTGEDTFYSGWGEAEIRLTEDTVIKKSVSIRTYIHPHTEDEDGGTIDSTHQAFINEVTRLKNLAASAAASAETSEENAAASAEAATTGTMGAEAWAVGERGGEPVDSSDETYHNNAKYYAQQADGSATSAAESAESVGNKNLISEGFAVGQQGGVDVDSSSPYYHNNSKYYAQQAAGSESSVSTNALKAEGFAVGQQGGEDVSSDSPYYQNNAEYYAGEADDSATAAAGSASDAETEALKAEGFAVGQQDGVDVDSSSPYYENNAEYYAGEAANAADAAETAAASASAAYGTDLLAADFSTSGTYAVGDYCIYSGNLYRCTTAITTGESWTAAHWSQVNVGGDLSVLKSAINALPDIKNSTETGIDLDVSDPDGNVIVRLKDGHIQTKNFDSSNAGNMTCYVSPNGLDSNSGDSAHPFLTIQHAVDTGYNRIMLAPGEYKNQKVDINGKHGISIICNTNQIENNLFESHKRQARAKVDNSIDVTGLTAYNSIFRTSLSVSTDSSYYKVFVSQEADPVYSGAEYYGRVTTYNAILWEITDNILTCTRLVPKLTLADCESTAGTFHYDGTYLYVHPTNGSLSGVSYKRLNDDTFTSVTNGFYIYNSTDINIEGLDVQFFPYYGFHANLTSGLTMRDCGFYFTCYGSACEFHTSNADLWECTAAQAGADGFGISTGGNVSVYNCNAVLCYDDGISHHDESTGIVDGGFWKYCKKGGVTPSYGSNVTVKNVIATNNVYGIYITQSETRVTNRTQYIQNCLAVDNTTKDIKVTGYNVIAHGCSYGVKEVDTGASLTEYNCTVIS